MTRRSAACCVVAFLLPGAHAFQQRSLALRPRLVADRPTFSDHVGRLSSTEASAHLPASSRGDMELDSSSCNLPMREAQPLPKTGTTTTTTTTRTTDRWMASATRTAAPIAASAMALWTAAAAAVLAAAPASDDLELAELPPPYVPAVFAVVLLGGVGWFTASLGNVMDEEASLGLQSGARAKKEMERSRSSYFKKK